MENTLKKTLVVIDGRKRRKYVLHFSEWFKEFYSLRENLEKSAQKLPEFLGKF